MIVQNVKIILQIKKYCAHESPTYFSGNFYARFQSVNTRFNRSMVLSEYTSHWRYLCQIDPSELLNKHCCCCCRRLAFLFLLFCCVRAKADLASKWGNNQFFFLQPFFSSKPSEHTIFSIQRIIEILCNGKKVDLSVFSLSLQWFVLLAIQCIIHQSKRCSVVRFKSVFFFR